MLRRVGIAAVALVALAAAGCGGSGGSFPYYGSTGQLTDRLGLDCDRWEEDHVQDGIDEYYTAACMRDGVGVAFLWLYPEREDDPKAVAEAMREDARSGYLACEYFGGGPWLLGNNWWLMLLGPENLPGHEPGEEERLEQARGRAGGVVVPGVPC